MKHIYVSTDGLGDWKKKLADPELHWKRTRSAFECAVSWEAANQKHGLPTAIIRVLKKSSIFIDPELLLAIPEHVVPLEGTGKGSQNDVWALIRSEQKVYSVSVEAKAGEDFDKTVTAWLNQDTNMANRRIRLQGLTRVLKIDEKEISQIRYQLLHRFASAIIEARRFVTSGAIMIIQSFKNDVDKFDDFEALCSLYETEARRNEVFQIVSFEDMPVFLAWIDSPLVKDNQIAKAV